SPRRFSWMRLFDCCREFWATNNPRPTIHSVRIYSSPRNTRDRPNSAVVKFPKSSFPEITPRSRNGEKSRRSSAPNKIDLICSSLMKKIILIALVLIVLVVAARVVTSRLGYWPVAATAAPSALESQFSQATLEASLARQARGLSESVSAHE